MSESGPAAGALMAAAYGKLTGHRDLVAFDMGGTTAKLSLVADGRPQTIREFELHRIRLQPGSGIPMTIQAIDLVELGAGGGSIARAETGVIRVGPDSAGAAPGPICYGLGGTEPTVTDANLVLRRIDGSRFLGATMPLDAAGAARAVDERLARRLALSRASAAAGVVRLADVKMALAVRGITTGRGLDPRDYALVAYGGGGPLHAVAIARELG